MLPMTCDLRWRTSALKGSRDLRCGKVLKNSGLWYFFWIGFVCGGIWVPDNRQEEGYEYIR
jgi:hypothetical protein